MPQGKGGKTLLASQQWHPKLTAIGVSKHVLRASVSAGLRWSARIDAGRYL
jgi:hypothetical protein